MQFVGTGQASNGHCCSLQQTRPHGTVWCAANFPVTGNERPAVPAKACLGINGQGRGAREGQTLCGPVSVSLGDSSRTKRRQRFRSNDVCDAIACPYRGQPTTCSTRPWQWCNWGYFLLSFNYTVARVACQLGTSLCGHTSVVLVIAIEPFSHCQGGSPLLGSA